MIQILNPIYDSSFKYLMSDEKVARILLSALLKRNVTSLAPASQEYIDHVKGRQANSDYTIYRLDFKANVEIEERDESGALVGRSEETILIEMQKVWLQTELLRFRKYLGGQYSDPANVKSDGKTPRRIVAIYLLGHKIPNMGEAIAYGYGDRLVDYDGQPVVTQGKSDFVESLTHDIVIVQIPRLPEKPANAAERILEVFNQRYRETSNPSVLSIPDRMDVMRPEEKTVVSKLRDGLLEPDIIAKIGMENEILEELDTRDLQIEKQKAELERKTVELERKDAELEKKDAEIEKKEAEIARNAAEKAEMNAELEKQKSEIERQKAQTRLAARTLRQKGMSPDEIAAILGIGADEVEKLTE